jgi:hypothetical protein
MITMTTSQCVRLKVPNSSPSRKDVGRTYSAFGSH